VAQVGEQPRLALEGAAQLVRLDEGFLERDGATQA
jgi:hypothetical protein